MPNKVHCLECEIEIQGRADKKYCSDYCRTTYHNKQNAATTNYMRNVNHILKKNRRILMSLNPKGKSKSTKAAMLDLGFKFSYYTNEYVTKAGKVYKFCYEQGYLDLGKDQYALVVRKEYVD